MSNAIEQLKNPLGQLILPDIITPIHIKKWINDLANFPTNLNKLVKDLSNIELESQYRPNSWNIKQIVHHCADSHMISYIRLKLALTEPTPTVKPYDENLWAQLADSVDCDITHSLHIIDGVHARWVFLLNTLSEETLEKTFYHPESKKIVSIKENTGIYAWHCLHHLAHIQLAIKNSH